MEIHAPGDKVRLACVVTSFKCTHQMRDTCFSAKATCIVHRRNRNKKRLTTLPLEEFLRRFLLYLLPRDFVRIHNFGFLANRRRAAADSPQFSKLLQRTAFLKVCFCKIS